LYRLRLDLALARLFPDHSRGYFQRCIHQGRVRLNGRPAPPKAPVMPGNTIDIRWPVEEVYDLVPEHVDFEVLAEDRDVIVINKPPGLVVHPSERSSTVCWTTISSRSGRWWTRTCGPGSSIAWTWTPPGPWSSPAISSRASN
jgi:23S rRNA-/tRNA-specific pseudouridylate synthase